MITKQLLLLTACMGAAMTIDAAQKKKKPKQTLNIPFRKPRPVSAPSGSQFDLGFTTEEKSNGTQKPPQQSTIPSQQHITALAASAQTSCAAPSTLAATAITSISSKNDIVSL